MALNHKGKIALITGANKGMGFEVARQLSAQGVTVFLGARNPHLGKFAEEKVKRMEQTHTSSNSMSQNQDYCQSRRTTPRATGQARHPR